MKKLNKKGFTLIELLAVIVILAIIVVVTVPTILNSINDARLSSLHSLAKEVANWYDTSAASDMIAIDPNAKILNGATATDEWQCLANVKNSDNKSLYELYGLSINDVYIGKLENESYINTIDPTDSVFEFDSTGKASFNPSSADYDLCSAIRLVNGRAEVYLVAKDGGKFDTNGASWAYALSSGANAFDSINE